MYKKTHYNKKQTHLCFLHRKTYFYNPEGDLWQRRQRTLFLQPRREAEDAIFIEKTYFYNPEGDLWQRRQRALFLH
jgi:N-acetylneuraminic acid mutarotase